MNAEMEKSELSGFERFLYLFFIPIVFVIVLIAVMLTLFDYNIMNGVLKEANKIPIVGSLLPEPKAEVKSTASPVTAADKLKYNEDQMASLNKKVTDQTTLLKSAETTAQQKDQAIKDLEAKNAALEEQLKTKTKTDAEYDTQVQQTAAMFAKMNPSKSAPIFENFTLKERVLILGQMKQADQVKLLEKMDPKKAADTAIYLKDVVPVKDQEIAALQDRIKLNNEASQNQNAQKLSSNDLGQTFSNMVPKSAATILLEMQAVNPNKVLEILNSMDNAGRSKVMAAFVELKKQDVAAAISAKLGP